MKPVSLKMTAFGPYGGTQSVDFTKLGDNELFLITGDTGAGKTTIFDGMSYAIYGKMAGDRTDSNIRSDFADPHTVTEVEFTFTHMGHEYKVIRSPSQMRPKERGHGETPKAMAAELHIDGKAQDLKPGKVTDRLSEILGIDFDQWRQIVMIAQGQFREILSTKTEKRIEILRLLFGTDSVLSFQNKAKELLKNASDSLKDVSKAITDAKNDSILTESDPDYERLCQMLESTTAVREFADALLESSERDRKEVVSLTTLKETRDNEKIELTRNIERTKADNKNLEDYAVAIKEGEELLARKEEIDSIRSDVEQRRLIIRRVRAPMEMRAQYLKKAEELEKEIPVKESELSAKKESHKAAAERLEVARSYEQEADEKNGMVAQLNAQRSSYESLAGMERDHTAIISMIQKNKVEESRLKTELDEVVGRKLQYREYINQHNEEDNALSGHKAELSNLIDDLKSLTALRGLITEYDRVVNEENGLRDELAKAETIRISATERHNLAYHNYISNYAGIIASELQPGTPCPVCGSTSHPSPAALSGEKVTEEQLKGLKTEAEKAERAVTEKGNAFAAAKTNRESKSDECIRTMQSLSDVTCITVDDVRKECDRLSDERKKQISEMEAEIRRLDEIHRNIERMNKELNEVLDAKDTEINDNLERLRSDLSKMEKDESKMKGMIESIKKNLVYSSLEELDSQINSLTQRIDAIRSEVDSASESVNTLSNEISSLESEITEKKKQQGELKESIAKNDEVIKGVLTEFSITEEICNSVLSEESSIESKELIVKDYDSKRLLNDESIKRLKVLTEGKEIVDVTEMEEKFGRLSGEIAELESKIYCARQRAETNEKVSRKLNELEKESSEQLKRLGDIKLISEVANGTAQGQKQSFETYLLGLNFKKVLGYANRRLHVMTDGRYVLKLNEGGNDERSKSGLDIDVHDNSTGKDRSSRTLSGGESFQAALSLAIGLSDAVQVHAGGIQIEALFVDEGFGSLDRESLRDAINMLQGIAGNKMIGIISHVEELKASIDKKIVVSNNDPKVYGSTISLSV